MDRVDAAVSWLLSSADRSSTWCSLDSISGVSLKVLRGAAE